MWIDGQTPAGSTATQLRPELVARSAGDKMDLESDDLLSPMRHFAAVRSAVRSGLKSRRSPKGD
jgi:hypothetical protein